MADDAHLPAAYHASWVMGVFQSGGEFGTGRTGLKRQCWVNAPAPPFAAVRPIAIPVAPKLKCTWVMQDLTHAAEAGKIGLEVV